MVEHIYIWHVKMLQDLNSLPCLATWLLVPRMVASASDDAGVYLTSSPALALGKSLIVSFDSGATKVVANLDWHLHVGLLVVIVTIVVSLSGESGTSSTQVFPNRQLGVLHQSLLRVGYPSRTFNLSMDDMGTCRSALFLTFL